jgi:hypothetical protein
MSHSVKAHYTKINRSCKERKWNDNIEVGQILYYLVSYSIIGQLDLIFVPSLINNECSLKCRSELKFYA